MDDTSIQVFSSQQFGELRALKGSDGEPWFVAKDVCEILGVGNSRQALSRLDDDEKGVILNDTPGGRQSVSMSMRLVSTVLFFLLVSQKLESLSVGLRMKFFRQFDVPVATLLQTALRAMKTFSLVRS